MSRGDAVDRRLVRSVPFLGLASVGIASFGLVATGYANGGTASLFVRTDSDQTTVISPRAAVTVEPTPGLRVDAAYTADVWTSASIDIRTAATKPITERRDQLEASASYELPDVTLGGGYYLSLEPDYTSHSLSFTASEELAGGSATLEERIVASYDVVGRAGDPQYSKPAFMVGGRVVYTQVLDPETILQGVAELRHRRGFQSSPYRFVGIGGDGICASTAIWCVPEAHPTVRTRTALVGRIRRSLSRDASIGVGYRFYADDWAVLSHTAALQIAWQAAERTTLLFRYRFYQQGAAGFYQRTYTQQPEQLQYVSRDRELSPLVSNRAAVSIESTFDLDSEGTALRFAATVGGTIFNYGDFVGLTEVYALDLTAAASLEL